MHAQIEISVMRIASNLPWDGHLHVHRDLSHGLPAPGERR